MVSPERIQKAVVAALDGRQKGKAASDLVVEVARKCRVNQIEVQRQVRRLLERGDVVVGPELNLVMGEPERQLEHCDHSG